MLPSWSVVDVVVGRRKLRRRKRPGKSRSAGISSAPRRAQLTAGTEPA